MIQDFVISLFVFLVVDPALAEIRESLEAAKVPTAVIAEVTTCVRDSGPQLAEKAWNDPWWGFTTTVMVGVGLTDAREALEAAAPGCDAALDKATGV